MKQTTEGYLQFLEDGLNWVFGFILAVWTWTSDQVGRMVQSPWETWPLWKQILLIIVAALVLYALYSAARQLWWAVLNLLSAFGTFIATLIVTLPAILLAGAIALAGLWVINNFHDLSSLRSIMLLEDDDAGSSKGGGAKPSGPAPGRGPAETIGGR